MDVIKKNVGDVEFTFMLNSRSNRSGFVHECELLMNGEHVSEAKAQYYNRTWESYRFQSVMLAAIDKLISSARDNMRRDEMRARGWKRLTQERRNEIGKLLDASPAYKILWALRTDVATAKYGTEEERSWLQTLDAALAMVEILTAKV